MISEIRNGENTSDICMHLNKTITESRRQQIFVSIASSDGRCSIEQGKETEFKANKFV